ncbi:MAG: T9SS type A sorting domain-containing protein [Bacteroidota bacterium]
MKIITKLVQLCLVGALITSLGFAQGTKVKNVNASLGTAHMTQKIVDMSPTMGNFATPGGMKALFDLQFQYNIAGPVGTAGIETDGQYFYVTKWSGNQFYRFDMSGALVDSFSIAGVTGVRDLAYDGQYFYGSATTNAIYQMNFTAHTLVSTITAPAAVQCRHIAYDPISDGFYCGNWATDIWLVSKTGTITSTILAATHAQTNVYGSAVDTYTPGGPYLWLLEQGGANANTLAQIDLATGTPTGTTFDVAPLITGITLGSDIAGGLCIANNVVQGTSSLIGVVQNLSIWGLELASTTYHPYDFGMTQLIHPLSSDSLTNADSVKIKIHNFDTLRRCCVPVSYVIDGGTPVTETISDSVDGGADYIYTFTTTADLSMPGHVYDFMLYTAMAGDSNYVNDTIFATVKNIWDVEATSIDMPPVVGVGPVAPLATFTNNGTLATSFDVTMNITGGYTSTKQVVNLAPGASQQVTFDSWTAALGNYTISIEAVLAQDSVPANDTLSQPISVQNLIKAFCYVAYDPITSVMGPAVTYLQAPGTVNILADQSAQNYLYGGTWGPYNKWYGAVATDNTFITIDTLTGARTVIGNMGAAILGMAYDFTTNKMYGVGTDNVNAQLYTVNLATGAVTLVGTSAAGVFINLACDAAGNLFAVNVTDDKLYSIDKATAAATEIGAIGFDANFIQGMDFDRNNNVLYMAAYNNTTQQGEMRIVDVNDGTNTLIGPFLNKAEIVALAIPYSPVLPSQNVGVLSITAPTSSCSLGSETVEAVVMNFGADTANNFDVAYELDGGTAVTFTVTTAIAPGATQTITFATPGDFSALGNHNIVAYTSLTGDTIAIDDTATLTVSNITPKSIPYSVGFEPGEDLTGANIFDVNNDGYTWGLATTGGNTGPYCLQYSYNSAAAANDWFISSCIDFEAGKTYKLSFFYKAQSASFPESVEVKFGTTQDPAAMSTAIVSVPSITAITYTESVSTFTVPSDGVYYVGFHCTSAADEWILSVDDINLTVDLSDISENAAPAINIFPNPAKDILNVTAGENIRRITVTNALGAVVFDGAMDSRNYILNTSEFNSGLYFIKCETENGRMISKFMVN